MSTSKSTSPSLLILAIFLVLGPAQARPIQLPSWLINVLPKKGATLADEIKCYSLPYGGIGFTSHVLTYWTILVLGFGRRPYWPWSRLSAGTFDLCLAITQVVVTVAIAAFTIARCRSRWQFVLLAVWKLVMSMVVGVWGISASRNARKASKYQLLAKPQSGLGLDEPRFPRPNVSADPPPSYQKDDPGYKAPRIWSLHDGTWSTLVIYGAAAMVGLVGLISLVVENFGIPGVWKITTVFGSLILGTGLAFLALWWCVDVSVEKRNQNRHRNALLRGLGFSGLGVIPFLMLILAAFYSDWVLGALAGSLVGVPSGDNAYLYWVKYKAVSSWQLPANWMPRPTLQRNGYPSSLRDLELSVPVCMVGVNFDEMSLCTADSTFRAGRMNIMLKGQNKEMKRSAWSLYIVCVGVFLASLLRWFDGALDKFILSHRCSIAPAPISQAPPSFHAASCSDMPQGPTVGVEPNSSCEHYTSSPS